MDACLQDQPHVLDGKMFRLPIFEGRIPTLQEFLPAFAWAIGMLVVGWIYFTSKTEEYAYRV